MLDAPSAAANDRVFTQVINLKRSSDRLAHMTDQLAALDLSFSRLSATDGSELDLEHDPGVQAHFDLDLWQRRHHRNPIATEIGCYLSHTRAIEAFLNQDKPFGLILEDDSVLQPDFAKTMTMATQVSQEWDILKLYASHTGPLVQRQRLPGQQVLCSFITKPASAAAYMLSHKAAERILDHAYPACRPFDWMFDESHKLHLKVRLILPMPVSLRRVASTIESGRPQRTRNWLSRHTDRPIAPRWSLPFRRASDDLHRISHNLISDGGLAAIMRGGLIRG